VFESGGCTGEGAPGRIATAPGLYTIFLELLCRSKARVSFL